MKAFFWIPMPKKVKIQINQIFRSFFENVLFLKTQTSFDKIFFAASTHLVPFAKLSKSKLKCLIMAFGIDFFLKKSSRLLFCWHHTLKVYTNAQSEMFNQSSIDHLCLPKTKHPLFRLNNVCALEKISKISQQNSGCLMMKWQFS